VVVPPGEVNEFGIRAAAEDLRVALAEFLVELAKCGDLGRTDESEILRPEEVNLPLALVVLVRTGL
jgi:hypothetical protein